MTIRCMDPLRDYQSLREEIDSAIADVCARGQFILGDQVRHFERDFALFVGAKHCVGVGNGYDAIRLALTALGVGPGDHVIVPAYTCTPTWAAVTATGATLTPVDADPDTGNIDLRAAERAVGPRTKAIVPVHLYGNPVDMAAVARLAEANGIKIVQDCAQAHGATSHGRPLGSIGDAQAWSFYPTKNLGAFGDGGAVTTNNAELAAQLRQLRSYGASIEGLPWEVGVNSRLDELQAAVLRVKLRHLSEWNQHRRRVAASYIARIQADTVRLPDINDLSQSAWHMFVVRSPQRDRLQSHLAGAGIETLIRYKDPPYLEAAFSGEEFEARRFPVAEKLRAEVLSLPIGPHLSADELGHIIDSVNAFRES